MSILHHNSTKEFISDLRWRLKLWDLERLNQVIAKFFQDSLINHGRWPCLSRTFVENLNTVETEAKYECLRLLFLVKNYKWNQARLHRLWIRHPFTNFKLIRCQLIVLTKVFVNEGILFVGLAINLEVKILCLFSIFINLLLQREFAALVGEVVWNNESFLKAFDFPALLWLATDIKCDESTSHIVFYRHRRASTFKENRPVNTSRVCTLVIINHGMANLGYFSHIYVLRKVTEFNAIDCENVFGITQLQRIVAYCKGGVKTIKLKARRRVLEIRFILHFISRYIKWRRPIRIELLLITC